MRKIVQLPARSPKIGIQVEENPQKESGYPDFYLTSQQQTVGEGSYQNGTCNIELYE